jgi:Fe-S-cluster containining protein
MDASGDSKFVQIVDAAMAKAVRLSGSWLACRSGCTQCCVGAFSITQLDASRMRRGLVELSMRDPDRATRVRERAREAVARYTPVFPGDPATGVLSDEPEERFWDDTDNDPCPALDLETGLCDLYESRPITCRAFGPPAEFGSESVAVCELCFDGASDDEIAACTVELDPAGMEPVLLEQLQSETGAHGETLVAFALTQSWPPTTKSDS